MITNLDGMEAHEVALTESEVADYLWDWHVKQEGDYVLYYLMLEDEKADVYGELV